MNKYIVLLFSILLFSSFTYSQNQKKIDSLLVNLKTQKEDTLKVNCLGSLCVSLCSSDPEKAISFGKQGLELSKKLNYEHGIAEINQNIGLVYTQLGDYVNSLKNLQLALETSVKLKDLNIESKCLTSIGTVHYYQKNFEKALYYYIKSLKVEEKIGDKLGVAVCLINIGNVHKMKSEYNEAMSNYKNALKLFIELDSKLNIAGCYNNIARMYEKQKDINSAIKNYQSAYEVNIEIGNKKGQAMVLANIANLNNIRGYYKNAVENATEALTISQAINDKYLECGICDIISESYDSLKDYKKALKYNNIYIVLNDSLFNAEKNEQLTEMETRYQTEKKQLEIEKLGKEKELQSSEMKKQRVIIIFVVVGLIVFLVFSFVLFRLFLQKKRANILLGKQNKEIQQQKEEISTQRDEIEAQRDEIEAQRDLVINQKEKIEEIHKEVTDSINYAKRIQEALLPVSNISRSVLGDHFIFFKPRNIVSGDFYWTIKINNLLIVAVADCTGHGVPGAFMSMLGISFLNEIVQKQEINKANQILNQLRLEIINALQQKGVQGEQKDGMDISLLVVNVDSNEAQWAGANNPLYIISSLILNESEEHLYCEVKSNSNKIDSSATPLNDNYRMIELKGDKMPIAIYPQMNDFTNHEFKLNKGDSVYLFTDGYADQFGGSKGRKFMYKHFKELLLNNNNKSMLEQCLILETVLTEWKGKNEQIDDITVLGMRIS
ncbi:MAG: tetratricopeptide repeat protein [Bacteroidia bacterium]|nr:tetratricopeptide repeat protein [Bacteroidia bacterium]